jgi:hemerythrin-like domain-containing protein
MTAISDPTTATTPDLRLYYWLHRAMRVHSARLHDALVALDPADRARARDIAWWYRGFKGELVLHHTLEDTAFFPALAARVPTFELHGDDLAADHVRLDEVIHRLERAIGSMAAPDGAQAAARPLAIDAAAELRDLLRDHLEVEDVDILPLFERHMPAEEYDALHEKAMKSNPPKQLLFTVPWLLCSLSAAEQAEVLAEVPLPMRVTWALTRRRHARRTVAALGTDRLEVA